MTKCTVFLVALDGTGPGPATQLAMSGLRMDAVHWWECPEFSAERDHEQFCLYWPVSSSDGSLSKPARDSSSAPGEIRTPDLLIRSQMLYPAELRAQSSIPPKWATV